VPFSFKLIFGLLSDCVPIKGQRRKPYLIMGWMVYIAANVYLASRVRPTINELIGLTWVFVTGYMLAAIVTDAIVVER